MRRLLLCTFVLLAVCAGTFFWWHFGSHSYRPPRTSFGDPDLQGLWTNASVSRLERSRNYSAGVISPERARKIEKSRRERVKKATFLDVDVPDELQGPVKKKHLILRGYDTFWMDEDTRMGVVNNEIRTSWVVDPPNGRVPYSEKAYRRMRYHFYLNSIMNDPEGRRVGERCLLGFGSSSGPPMMNVEYNNFYQIVQSPGYVAITVEMVHDTRIIRLTDKRLPDNMRLWMGDSIGRWEGNTLVVETINRHPAQEYGYENSHLLYIGPKGKITERFTRVADDEILYQFTVEDPESFTQPWKAELPMRRTPGPMYEFACHEGNRSMELTLGGARYLEKNAGKK